jgi:hypothetical protein
VSGKPYRLSIYPTAYAYARVVENGKQQHSVGRRGVLRRASLAQDDNSSIAAENLRDLTPETGHLLSEVQHEPRRSAIAVLGGVEQVQMQVVA